MKIGNLVIYGVPKTLAKLGKSGSDGDKKGLSSLIYVYGAGAEPLYEEIYGNLDLTQVPKSNSYGQEGYASFSIDPTSPIPSPNKWPGLVYLYFYDMQIPSLEYDTYIG